MKEEKGEREELPDLREMMKEVEEDEKGKLRITVCCFTDNKDNAIAYKKFDTIEFAVDFYQKQLSRDDVNVISTRKVYLNEASQ